MPMPGRSLSGGMHRAFFRGVGNISCKNRMPGSEKVESGFDVPTRSKEKFQRKIMGSMCQPTGRLIFIAQ